MGWLMIAAWTLTTLSAVGARCLAHFSRSQLDELCQRREDSARLGVILHRYSWVGLGMEAWQVVMSAVFLASVGWLMLGQPRQEAPDLAQGIFGGLAALLGLWAGVIWIPSALAQLAAAPVVYFLWRFWEGLACLMLPTIWAARIVSTLLHRVAGRPEQPPDEKTFEQEIRTIVSEGHREGLLEEDAREMIESVIRLNDVQVSQIMVPRTDMVTIPITLSWTEMLQNVIASEHTRIPVYEKNRDDLVGILHAKDLLPELAKPSTESRRPWTELLREPYFVPETKPVDVLLEEFQRTRNHMAVVLDEYGGVAGIVTLEDVLEEIVGEIEDEYDQQQVQEEFQELAPGIVEVSARMHIEDLNERLGLHLPEDADYDTLGGFVFSELGHVPVAGETLLWNSLRITVLQASRRRIERLRIETLPPSEEDSGQKPSAAEKE